MSAPRALLVVPPVYDFALFDLFLKPYGLLRVGRWLAEGGYEVRVVDGLDYTDPASAALLGWARRGLDGTGKFFKTRAETPQGLKDLPRRYSRYGLIPEVFRSRIASWNPDLVLITSGMTYWYPGVVEAAETARAVYPDVPVVVGGIYASLLPDHCGKVTGADVAAGEGALGLAPLLVKYGLPVPGLSMPYEPIFIPHFFSQAGIVRLNEGCPCSCSYCASRRISPRFIAGDPDAVFDMVLKLHRRFGTRNFALYDDAFLFDPERGAIPFLSRIAAELPGLSFYSPNALHLSFIDEAIAALLHDAGFREIRLGYESSSAHFHERYDRKIRADALCSSVAALTKAGFSPRDIIVYILAGLPGQYASEVEDTIHSVSEYGVRISVSEFSPVPGSPLWDECVRLSPYPIADEPLYQNNSFFATAWEGFSREDMWRIKLLVRRVNGR